MKTFRITFAVLFAACLLLGLSTIAFASGQPVDNLTAVSVPPANVPPPPSVRTVDDPARAVPIDNLPHTIAANSATWFSFNYNPTDNNGNHIFTTITLVNGYNSGVRFEVWTAAHMLDWWNGNKPVGQGTVANVTCDPNQPAGQGPCQSTDLTWLGSFNVGGTYFVRVVNDSNQPVIFQLTIS